MAVNGSQLEKRVLRMGDMPTFPSVVKHISRMVEDKKSSAADVGNLIAKDQVISAKVLRLVNSPVYGFPSRISSITHALVLLGFTVVKGLVLSTAVFDTFGKSMVGLWEHSLGCAIMSRHLARELEMDDIEEIMIAGLLHDLGKAVESFVAHEEFDQVLEVAHNSRCHIAKAERQVFEVDHARVASWLAREWHLPASLAEPLTYHHRPDLAKAAKQPVAVVHVADILARAMEFGWPGDDTMPPIVESAYRALGLTEDQLARVIEQADLEFSAGADVLSGE